MGFEIFQGRYLSVVCNLLEFCIVIISILIIVFSNQTGLFEATLYFPIVAYGFFASILITFALSIYVGIELSTKADRFHSQNPYERLFYQELLDLDARFLAINQFLFTILILVAAICSYAMKSQMFTVVDNIFDDYAHGFEKAGKFVNNTEQYFGCHNFDSHSPLGNCAAAVQVFLDSKLFTIFVVLLSLSFAFIVFLLASFYILCGFPCNLCKKKKKKPRKIHPNNQASSIEENLNQIKSIDL